MVAEEPRMPWEDVEGERGRLESLINEDGLWRSEREMER